jgi:hypothetical protein
MVRRFLCLGAALLALVLSAPGCGQSKTQNKAPTVPDPEGGAKPMVPRGG